MTKTRSTKRALLMSALSLLLCVSMLIGTTYAWFTDSVTSGVNTIQAGNLDVVLEYATWDSTTGTWGEYSEVSAEKCVFNENALWEPGYTEVVKFRVTNAGTLALKYQFGMDVYSETESTNVADGKFKLSDFIRVGSTKVANVTDRNAAAQYATKNINDAKILNVEKVFGTEIPANCLYPQNSPEGQASADNYCSEWVFVAHMPTTVGNEANHKTGVDAPKITFGVNLLATQNTYEKDSFDDQYDKDAEYGVTNADELKDALQNGGDFMIANDIVVDDTLDVAKETTIDLNGNILDVKAINANADLTITDSGEITGKPIRYQEPATIIVDNGATVTLDGVDVSTTDWGSYQEEDGVSGGEMFALYIVDGNVVMNNGDLIIKEPEQAATYGSAYGLIIENGTFTMNGGAIVAADGMANPFAIGATVNEADDECVINLNNVDIQTKYMISLVGSGKCTVNLTNTDWDAKWTYKRYFNGTYVLNQN